MLAAYRPSKGSKVPLRLPASAMVYLGLREAWLPLGVKRMSQGSPHGTVGALLLAFGLRESSHGLRRVGRSKPTTLPLE